MWVRFNRTPHSVSMCEEFVFQYMSGALAHLSMRMYMSLPYSDRIRSGFMTLKRLPTSNTSCTAWQRQGGDILCSWRNWSSSAVIAAPSAPVRVIRWPKRGPVMLLSK